MLHITRPITRPDPILAMRHSYSVPVSSLTVLSKCLEIWLTEHDFNSSHNQPTCPLVADGHHNQTPWITKYNAFTGTVCEFFSARL